MAQTKLRWSGSRRAQAEAEHAYAKLKPKQPKATAAKPKRRKRKRPEKWTGTLRAYLKTARWQRKRQAAFDHYGQECGRCGSTRDLDVHHRHYRRLGREKMKDLEVLCSECHLAAHGLPTTLDREFEAIVAP
jgi:5-methylcytosine-specific restriction endonuclease McrA